MSFTHPEAFIASYMEKSSGSADQLQFAMQTKRRHKSEISQLTDELHSVRKIIQEVTAEQKVLVSALKIAAESKHATDEVRSSKLLGFSGMLKLPTSLLQSISYSA